jgi:hypothetical protein
MKPTASLIRLRYKGQRQQQRSRRWQFDQWCIPQHGFQLSLQQDLAKINHLRNCEYGNSYQQSLTPINPSLHIRDPDIRRPCPRSCIYTQVRLNCICSEDIRARVCGIRNERSKVGDKVANDQWSEDIGIRLTSRYWWSTEGAV